MPHAQRGATVHQRGQVVGPQVAAYRAGSLRTAEQAVKCLVEPLGRSGQRGFRPALVGGERVTDALAAGGLLDHLEQEAEECVTRRGPGGPPVGGSREAVDMLGQHRLEQHLLAREVPADGPGADSSALRDAAEGHLKPSSANMRTAAPGGWLANQYDNPANPLAHVRTTGPEIWQQTEGRITHFVVGVGTGGTIGGTGRYLKEVSGGRVRIVGADPENSRYSGGDGSPYYVESVGHFLHPETEEDVWPESFQAEVVDQFERVSDRESLEITRRLALEDGLLAGPSSGTAMAAALRVACELGPSDLVVVLLPDSGRSYLSKVFSDDWMRRWGFLEEPPDGTRTVADVLARRGPDGGQQAARFL